MFFKTLLCAGISMAGVGVLGLALSNPLQAQSGPQPGETDPVGNHLSLFPDDSLFGFSPELPGGQINARLFPVSTTPNLSLPVPNIAIHLPASLNPIYVASGRILAPNHESVAVVQRDGASPNVRVDLIDPQKTASIEIAKPGTLGLPDRTKFGTDAIAVAVGDIDNLVDSQGSYHDDIAVVSANASDVTVDVYSYAKTDASGNPAHYANNAFGPSANLPPAGNPVGIAIGDFDGDGKNEIAVVCSGNAGIGVSILRLNLATGMLELVKNLGATVPGLGQNQYASTISVKAANLNGGNRDQLIIGSTGYQYNPVNGTNTWSPFVITLGFTGGNLAVTSEASTILANIVSTGPQNASPVKVEVATGQFLFDPINYPFGTQQIAVAYNNANDQLIDIKEMSMSADLTKYQNVLSTTVGTNPDFPAVPGKQFWLAAGGFTGNSNPQSPTSSLAVAAWTPNGGQGVYWIRTIAISPTGLSLKGLIDYGTPAPDGTLNAPVVATDWDGKSVYLGAPAHITLENVISSDYIVEEPPKHSYWDDNAKQTLTVTNYDSNNSTFSYSNGSSTSSKSTDHSNWTIGGSLAVSAGATATVGEDIGLEKATVDVSTDITAKGSYDYNKNQSSYNSSYGSRTFTISAATDHDDYLQGRLQTIDVWRYRVYGLNETASNNFYDIMLPGPTIPFSEGGLNFGWYQPVHENGNILTYPQKFNWSDSQNNYPADLGSYTDSDGSVKTEPLIPIEQSAFDGTTGSLKLDLSSTRGSGQSVDTSNTLAESLDVKTSASASVEFLGNGGKVNVSAEANFHNSNSWGSATTSDNTTTTDMTIAVNKGSGNSSQAYAFEPAVYMAQNGTFKLSYDVPNPGSPSNTAGAAFWNGIYGGKPDPALNLPQRFVPTYASNNIQNGWAPNLLSNRKQMRGLFFRQTTLDPATKDFDFLTNAATDGDQVRIEARIYNESTSQAAEGTTVSFYTIPYNSGTNSEVCAAPINGATTDTTNLLCPATARALIGTASVPTLQPLQYTCLSGTDNPAIANCAAPVFINWNTKGFGPSLGTNSYRIYVVLTPDPAFGEIYGSDGAPMQITSITGGSPIVVTTATPHNMHSGDYVTIGQSTATSNINSTYQITWTSNNSFGLNGTNAGAGTYPGGGTATYFNAGQNDEGFGMFDVQSAPSLQATRGSAANDDYLTADSVQAIGLGVNQLTAGPASAYQNQALQIRVAVFSSGQHILGRHLLLFDGDPNTGAPAIADQLVHPGNNGTNGTYVWFNWTPKTPGAHHLYAKLIESVTDTQMGNNEAELNVNVISASGGAGSTGPGKH